ncbi:hypothetical protein [Leptolyngbya sp. AS-A5]|uniref:hypothetical protein n=1 Tax=Leptolyngbya sp. AS-A5 TaxID=2933919 RepID=UPI0032991106
MTINNGDFSGQSAAYLGAWNSDSACLSINGEFAALPISWLELPQSCNSFKSPTKSMRLLAHLEGQLRAYALHLEGQILIAVTANQEKPKPIRKSVSRVGRKTGVTRKKRDR